MAGPNVIHKIAVLQGYIHSATLEIETHALAIAKQLGLIKAYQETILELLNSEAGVSAQVQLARNEDSKRDSETPHTNVKYTF